MIARAAFSSVAASLLVALSTSAPAASVVVVSTRGSVVITQADHAVHVRDAGELTLPAQIKTGADGAVDLKDNQSQIHIGPHSTIALPDAGAAGSLVDHYLQSAGSALYNIQARHGRPMSVETPYLVSVVKGTVFTIAVDDGATRVTLMEGSLDVSAPGVDQHVLLKPNQSIQHRAGESSLVVIPASTGRETLPPRTSALAGSMGEDVSSAQVAMVNRDLAEVGATVATQRTLASVAMTHPAPPPAAGSNPSPVAGAGSPNGGGGTAVGSNSGGPPATPPNPTSGTSSGSAGSSGSNPGTAGTPGSVGSGAAETGTSGNGTGSGTTASNPSGPQPPGTTSSGNSGSNTSNSDSNSSGSSGSNGSSSSGSDDTATPGAGCNGKNNGTGMGNCKGQKKH